MALGDLAPVDTWRLKAEMPNGTVIPFKLVDGYPKGSFEEETGEITEQYIIEAKRLMEFICYSFSEQEAWPGLPNWVYRPPRSYRTKGDVSGGADSEVSDALASMVTKKIAFEMYPVGRPGDPFLCDEGGTIYEPGVGDVAVGGPEDDTYAQYVLVTITYGPGKATEGSAELNFNDVLDIRANASGEFIMLSSNAKLRWQGDPRDVAGAVDWGECKEANVNLTKVLPGVEWVVKFKRVPFSELSGITSGLLDLLGKVNDSSVELLNNAEYETILFMGFNYTSYFSWRNAESFVEMELKFVQRRVAGTIFVDTYGGEATETEVFLGWNHFWSPENRRWLYLVDADGIKMYEEADLGALIFRGFPE